MRATKEAELNIALLRYVAQCLEEGDLDSLAHLGLDRADAEAVAAFVFADLNYLGSSRFPLLHRTAINRDLLRRLIEHVRQLRVLKELRDEILALDAPHGMMHHFFGMDSTEYAERGRALGVIRLTGRPGEPREDEEAAIWKAYEGLAKDRDEGLTPEDYLSLHKATRVPLRTLWMLIQRGLAEGPPSNRRNESARR